MPLEVRFHHEPSSTHGFVGAAMSSNIIHWYKKDQEWIVEKIIDVENEKHPEWPIPLPGLITVILISMDDRFLYFCNWLHGDIRQYDITDPHNPVMTGQVWMGGMLKKAPVVNGVEIRRWAPNDSDEFGREAFVCDHVIILYLGQPVLS